MIKNILFLLVVFLTNIIQCITGFAGTVLAMPFSVMLIGYDAAKAILNLLGLLASVYIVIICFKHINKKELGKMTGIMLAQVILGTAFSWWEGMIVTKTQNSFRANVFGHVLASEWHGREAFHSGDMVNRLEEDTRVVVDLLCVRVPDFIVTLVQLVAASGFLFVLEPSLLWVLLILMPVAAIGSKMFFKTIRRLTSLIRAKDSEIQGHMQENLQQRVLVKTLGCEDRVLGRLDDLQGDVIPSAGSTIMREPALSCASASWPATPRLSCGASSVSRAAP